MAENERRQKEIENVDPASKKNVIYISVGIALVVIALGVVFYAMYLRMPKVVPVVTENPSSIPSVVRVDSTTGLNVTGLTRDNLREQIGKQYTNASQKINTVQRILPFTQGTTNEQHVLTTEEFFNAIESVAPGPLVRSFDPTFTMGVYAYNGSGLFLAFKTNAYTTALAGMLEWEQSMFDELYSVFAIPTSGDNAKLFSAQFKDVTIKNQDARALLDATGKPVLFYTFVGEDKSTLIIADKDQTLLEILNRLTANTLRH